MWGGRTRGWHRKRGQTANNALDYLFVCSAADQDSRCLCGWNCSSEICNTGPCVHFTSTHMMNDLRSSLFLSHFHFYFEHKEGKTALEKRLTYTTTHTLTCCWRGMAAIPAVCATIALVFTITSAITAALMAIWSCALASCTFVVRLLITSWTFSLFTSIYIIDVYKATWSLILAIWHISKFKKFAYLTNTLNVPSDWSEATVQRWGSHGLITQIH